MYGPDDGASVGGGAPERTFCYLIVEGGPAPKTRLAPELKGINEGGYELEGIDSSVAGGEDELFSFGGVSRLRSDSKLHCINRRDQSSFVGYPSYSSAHDDAIGTFPKLA